MYSIRFKLVHTLREITIFKKIISMFILPHDWGKMNIHVFS